MAISQRVYVTNVTCGMFSEAFSLCWLRARAYLITFFSASHLDGSPMNAFLKDEELGRYVFLDIIETISNNRTRNDQVRPPEFSSNFFCQRQTQ
jgi:hypothetical protein